MVPPLFNPSTGEAGFPYLRGNLDYTVNSRTTRATQRSQVFKAKAKAKAKAKVKNPNQPTNQRKKKRWGINSDK